MKKRNAAQAGMHTSATSKPTLATAAGEPGERAAPTDSNIVAAMKRWGTPESFSCLRCERESTTMAEVIDAGPVGFTVRSYLGVCPACKAAIRASPREMARVKRKAYEESGAVLCIRVADLAGCDPRELGAALAHSMSVSTDAQAAMRGADALLSLPAGTVEACINKIVFKVDQ